MTRYVIQPKQSVVRVQARSSLHPFTGSGPVSGHFDAEVRDGRLDLSTPPGGALHMQVEDLRGDMPGLDRELRNRLHMARFPAITAVLTEVSQVAPDDYRMAGELTLHGRTKLVVGQASIDIGAGGSLRLQGAMALDIRDFGLVPPKVLLLKVHPDIQVQLDFVAALPGSTD